MSASRVAVLAAVTAVVAWGLKAVAIGVAGGLDRSPFETPLFGLGLVAILIAFVALGVAVARHRSIALQIVGGIGGLAIGLALSLVASWIASAAIPRSAGWVQGEAGLWLSALLALIATTWWHAQRGPAPTAG